MFPDTLNLKSFKNDISAPIRAEKEPRAVDLSSLGRVNIRFEFGA